MNTKLQTSSFVACLGLRGECEEILLSLCVCYALAVSYDSLGIPAFNYTCSWDGKERYLMHRGYMCTVEIQDSRMVVHRLEP